MKDLQSLHGKADNIKQVCCDMSPAFIKGVKENLSQAELTFDKFHIIKIINEAVDQVRREEVKSEIILKKSRYLFLKNRVNLTQNESTRFTAISLSKKKLKTFRAYMIRESFQEIYASRDIDDFKINLKKWYFWATHSQLKPMIKAAKTIKSHWDGVVNWMKSKISNGILEGFNSMVQAAKAKARGFKKFEYFRTIIYLLLGKLDFKKLNNYYSPI